MSSMDVIIDRIDEGPFDPLGNPFVTIAIKNDPRVGPRFDAAMDEWNVKRVFLRSMSSGRNEWRIRFTAYDKDGSCITDKVISTVNEAYKGGEHEIA